MLSELVIVNLGSANCFSVKLVLVHPIQLILSLHEQNILIGLEFFDLVIHKIERFLRSWYFADIWSLWPLLGWLEDFLIEGVNSLFSVMKSALLDQNWAGNVIAARPGLNLSVSI